MLTPCFLIPLYLVIHITIMIIVHKVVYRVVGCDFNKNEKKWWFYPLIIVYFIITPMKLWGNVYGVKPRDCNKSK